MPPFHGASQSVRTVDVLDLHPFCSGIIRSLNDKDFDLRLSCRLHFFDKAATQAAFLGKNSLRTQLFNQCSGIIFLVENEVINGKTSLLSLCLGFFTVEDAEPAIMPLPVRTEFPDGLHTRQGQQPRDAVGFQSGNSVIIIVAPTKRFRVGARIHPFDADDGDVERSGNGGHGAMELCREGVRRIDQQADLVFFAEDLHGRRIERAGDMFTVLALDLLQVAARRVPIRRSRRIGHPDSEASFRRTAENQDHGRNKCLNSCA